MLGTPTHSTPRKGSEWIDYSMLRSTIPDVVVAIDV